MHCSTNGASYSTGSDFSRVERWRGGLGVAYLCPALSSAGASLAAPCSVSTSRSSNRACEFPAHGSPTGFSRQHTMALYRSGRDSANIAIFAGKYSSFRDRLVFSGVDRQSQSPDCWSLPVTRQKSGSSQRVQIPSGQSVARPEAIRASKEATNSLKYSGKGHLG